MSVRTKDEQSERCGEVEELTPTLPTLTVFVPSEMVVVGINVKDSVMILYQGDFSS